MTDLFSQPVRYWTAGGPLLVPIAAVCFGIWAYFLRTRRIFLQAIGSEAERPPATHPEAPARITERRLAGWRRDLVVLAALTAVAPLLGLLGTVIGMIKTFEAVAGSTGDTASHVASGISQALMTTQFGLAVAIPGVFGLARLERLYRQVRVHLAQYPTRLLPAEPACEAPEPVDP